jgi:hypothetical protein
LDGGTIDVVAGDYAFVVDRIRISFEDPRDRSLDVVTCDGELGRLGHGRRREQAAKKEKAKHTASVVHGRFSWKISPLNIQSVMQNALATGDRKAGGTIAGRGEC